MTIFKKSTIAASIALSGVVAGARADTVTIATVNNGDMVRMQKLTEDFTSKNPGIELEWVTLEENVLRQRVTTDVATKGGQYDVMTIGTYEVPIWAGQDWLMPLDDLATTTMLMTSCQLFAADCQLTAPCMPHLSTASPQWSCIAPT